MDPRSGQVVVRRKGDARALGDATFAGLGDQWLNGHYDVLGHVNNAVYWAIVEEQMARLRQVRAPLTVTLEHHDAIDPGDVVTVAVLDTERGFDLWVTALSSDDSTVIVNRGFVPLGAAPPPPTTSETSGV